MKKIFLTLIFLSALNSKIAEAKTWDKINILACTPEWGSLAQEIVADKAIIFVASNAMQDPHAFKSDSNLLAKIRNTNLIFCSGAGQEDSWLPGLLKQSSRDDIKVGGVGNLMAADYVQKLEVPVDNNIDSKKIGSNFLDKNIDAKKDEIHSLGNPHIHLNPHNISLVAAEFLKRVSKIDPDNAEFYQKRYNDFMARWNESIKVWEKNTASIKNMPIMINHDYWAYMNDWLGLKVVGKLEEKYGTVPSNKYMKTVLQSLKMNPANMIIHTQFEDSKVILWMRTQSKSAAAVLPYTVGVKVKSLQVNNLFDLFDLTTKILVEQNRRKLEIDKNRDNNLIRQIHS